jgi:hypothetical protein
LSRLPVALVGLLFLGVAGAAPEVLWRVDQSDAFWEFEYLDGVHLDAANSLIVLQAPVDGMDVAAVTFEARPVVEVVFSLRANNPDIYNPVAGRMDFSFVAGASAAAYGDGWITGSFRNSVWLQWVQRAGGDWLLDMYQTRDGVQSKLATVDLPTPGLMTDYSFAVNTVDNTMTLYDGARAAIKSAPIPAFNGQTVKALWLQAANNGPGPDAALEIAADTLTINGQLNEGPVISVVTMTPEVVGVGQEVSVAATVTDDFGLSSVKIRYDVDGIEQAPITMTDVGTWEGMIPAQLLGSRVRAWVQAEDTSEKQSASGTFTWTVGGEKMKQSSPPKTESQTQGGGGAASTNHPVPLWVYGLLAGGVAAAFLGGTGRRRK